MIVLTLDSRLIFRKIRKGRVKKIQFSTKNEINYTIPIEFTDWTCVIWLYPLEKSKFSLTSQRGPASKNQVHLI